MTRTETRLLPGAADLFCSLKLDDATAKSKYAGSDFDAQMKSYKATMESSSTPATFFKEHNLFAELDVGDCFKGPAKTGDGEKPLTEHELLWRTFAAPYEAKKGKIFNFFPTEEELKNMEERKLRESEQMAAQEEEVGRWRRGN